MLEELFKPVFVIVVAFLLRGLVALVNKALELLGVEARLEMSEPVFNSIVAALVVYLLALLGVEAGVRAGLLG